MLAATVRSLSSFGMTIRVVTSLWLNPATNYDYSVILIPQWREKDLTKTLLITLSR